MDHNIKFKINMEKDCWEMYVDNTFVATVEKGVDEKNCSKLCKLCEATRGCDYYDGSCGVLS